MSETQTLELVIKKITPAQVESNIEQLDTYMSNVTEHYKNWIVTEDSLKEAAIERTKLNINDYYTWDIRIYRSCLS